MANHFLVCIIVAVFFQGSAAQPLEHGLLVIADQVDDLEHVNLLFHDFCLLDCARDAVEDKQVIFRF